MAKAQITLIISFLVFYYLTRQVWVKVIKNDRLIIELHLPLLALSFKSKSKNKDKRKKELGALTYLRICSKTLSHIKKCHVEINEVTIPIKSGEFGAFSLIKPYGQQGLAYAIIAFLKTKADRLIIKDNAVISSPDINQLQFHIIVKLRLFQLIYALLTIRRGINEEKKARRIKYVGE